MKEKIIEICNEVADERPYKQKGNPDSYNSYNEGWTDACDVIEQSLIEQLTHPEPPQSGVVDIYEERAHHSHTATSLDTAPTEMQILKWQNKALVEALQYLVDTKERKDTIGKDSIYMARKDLGWRKAKLLLNDIKD